MAKHILVILLLLSCSKHTLLLNCANSENSS